MKKKTKQSIISALTIFIFLAALFSGTLMSQVEIPLYQVNDKHAAVEIRQYPPLVVAEVTVTGDRGSAISKGFKTLAGYIFGNNQSSERIAMTAPVTQENKEKIATATPVLETGDHNQWKIRFLMPKKYTINTLPKPLDPQVNIHEIPSKTYATIKFAGLSSKTNLDNNLKLLQDFIKGRGLQAESPPIFAFYNPPWTLPFLRRNEIWIEIHPKSQN